MTLYYLIHFNIQVYVIFALEVDGYCACFQLIMFTNDEEIFFVLCVPIHFYCSLLFVDYVSINSI